MKSLSDFDFKNKKVLLRADFNVSLGDDGQIDEKEDWRLEASLPTIKYLLDKKARIILMTHLGRPKGKFVKELKTDPIAKRLEELLNQPVKKVDGYEVRDSKDQIILLENLRFNPGEEKNDPDFAKQLAQLGEIYLNNAFAVSHRSHASIVGLPNLLPSGAGLLLEKEIKALSKVLGQSEHPIVIIIGGAKISTKIKLIKSFLAKADHILLGGALANTALKAKGIDVKKSVVEDEMLEQAREFIDNPKVHLPVDWIESEQMILDIGKETIKEFEEIISSAKTIIFNGPMGLFEKKQFQPGSEKISQAIVESDSFSLAGGGDTIVLLENLGLLNKIDHVSTGGGAMLEFLSGKKLPGIEILR